MDGQMRNCQKVEAICNCLEFAILSPPSQSLNSQSLNSYQSETTRREEAAASLEPFPNRCLSKTNAA